MRFLKYILLDLYDEDEDLDSSFIYSSNWFESVDNFTEQKRLETFRMGRNCFELLLIKISNYKKILNLKHKLRIFIYYISHASTYRVLRKLFDIPKTTLCNIINDIGVVLSEASAINVMFPLQEELDQWIFTAKLGSIDFLLPKKI